MSGFYVTVSNKVGEDPSSFTCNLAEPIDLDSGYAVALVELHLLDKAFSKITKCKIDLSCVTPSQSSGTYERLLRIVDLRDNSWEASDLRPHYTPVMGTITRQLKFDIRQLGNNLPPAFSRDAIIYLTLHFVPYFCATL